MADAPASIRLRPATEADRDLLLEIYASTRAEELRAVPWDDDAKRAFIVQQFEAQASAYSQNYANATFDIVLVDERPAGRLYVDRRPSEIRIVDIALLPEHRSRGVGTRLLGEII